jgi:hypothetical protein
MRTATVTGPIGAGLTPATDALVVKGIIGYRPDFLGRK